MGKGKEMITLRELKEKAVSKQQQKLMGLALAYKRGEVEDSKVSDTVKDLAKSMSTKELEDFASTKHKSLPDKVNEAKSSTGYELYHRDFSSAMQHAYKHAKAKLGVDVDDDEIWRKVAMGPSKPSKGKTNSYRLLDKNGKKAIQVQVYGMDNGKYELNMYKESVNEAKDPGEYDQEGDMAKTQLKTIMRNASDLADLLDDNENMPEWVQNKITKASDYMTSAYNYMASEDDGGKMDEEMDPTKHVSKKGDMYCVYNKDGEEIAKFDNKKDADAYAIKNHDKLMEYLEVGTDAIRKSYAAMTPGQNEALAPIDRVAIAGTVALGAKGIGKTKKAVGNLAKKVTKLGSKPKPIASKPKPDTSADTTTPNKRPMPAKSNFSNLRKRQQTRAKTKMGSKKTPIRRV